jgi:rhodanese-related sulfurtransferase
MLSVLVRIKTDNFWATLPHTDTEHSVCVECLLGKCHEYLQPLLTRHGSDTKGKNIMTLTHWSAIALSCFLTTTGCSHNQNTAAMATPVAVAHATEQARDELRRVSVDELAGMIERHEQVAIFDNNGQEMYMQGHVPGARSVGYDSVTAEVLPTDRAAKLVFYCASEQCTACHTAARQAVTLGYTNVWILPAGISGWRAANRPVVAGPNPV